MKKKFSEDAPTNATGGSVPGTGDDKSTVKIKKKKKKILKRLKATYEVGRKPDRNLEFWETRNLIEKKTWKDVIKRVNDPDGSIQIQGRIHKQNAKGTEVIGYSLANNEFSVYDDMEHFLDWASHKEYRLIVVEDRNYRKEYDNYHSKPEQREKNAARLRARRLMVKKGKVKKNDKMDVHHKDNNPLNNDPKNLSVTTQKYNRTEPRLREEGEQAPTPDLTPDATFAQMPVFKVSQDDFQRCKDVKKKYARWNKHIDTESDYGKKIHGYAKKNPKSAIIVQDDKSGNMVYLKKYSQLEK